MPTLLPQELDVWYIIPAIRRELANILSKDFELKQKEVAELLQVSEAAISQYKKSKRGLELKFSDADIKMIQKSASKIIKDNSLIQSEVFHLTKIIRKSPTACKLHHKLDPALRRSCDICK